jgi:hypothetical protein
VRQIQFQQSTIREGTSTCVSTATRLSVFTQATPFKHHGNSVLPFRIHYSCPPFVPLCHGVLDCDECSLAKQATNVRVRVDWRIVQPQTMQSPLDPGTPLTRLAKSFHEGMNPSSAKSDSSTEYTSDAQERYQSAKDKYHVKPVAQGRRVWFKYVSPKRND